jgi:hypothetical protein
MQTSESGWRAGTVMALFLMMRLAASAQGASWKEVQQIKQDCVQSAAQHAMEQQKTTQAAPLAIPFPEGVTSTGNVKLMAVTAESIPIDVTAEPWTREGKAVELVRFRLPQAIDMVAQHSGLAFTVKTEPGASREVRIGCRLLAANGKAAEVTPIIPAVNRWGDNPHEVYLDWAFLNYANAAEAVGVLNEVEAVEITFGAIQRAPLRGPSEKAQAARFTISDLRLVDYHKGSYDPSRQWRKYDEAAGKWVPAGKDLTLQQRCMEVTGLVAIHGGEKGILSAVDSLDMAVRTQCWDGSLLDGRRGARTVASGEYTYGFTTYGLLVGYMTLEKLKSPLLEEKLTVGPFTMTRRDFYQRMFYRLAMSRAGIAKASEYRDDIIGGNTLITGANRVLGYAIAMRMVADVLTDPAKKKEVLDNYGPYMQEIADTQGQFSGGFPVLGEGDQYQGKGIHYDAGYVRTHMDWLIVGAVRTGDPLLVQMLRKYQTVFEAAMDAEGKGILGMISERHRGPFNGSVELVLPDATWQVGAKYRLPIVAQWGYNDGMAKWLNWDANSGNHFTAARHARGYDLGTFMGRLVEDMAAEPEPRDLGYLFPRQFPIWSTRLYTKEGKLVRTSSMVVSADGTEVSNYRIEVGEWPATVGLPILLRPKEGKVTAVAERLLGWPKLLPDGAEIEISGDLSAKGKLGETIALTLQKKTKLAITGPDIALPPEAIAEGQSPKVPFRAELTLVAEKPGQTVELTVLHGTVPYQYELATPPSAPAPASAEE